MFPEYQQPPGTFTAGMKIEAVDPLNLASVCVATVMQVSSTKVLGHSYLQLRLVIYERLCKAFLCGCESESLLKR